MDASVHSVLERARLAIARAKYLTTHRNADTSGEVGPIAFTTAHDHQEHVQQLQQQQPQATTRRSISAHTHLQPEDIDTCYEQHTCLASCTANPIHDSVETVYEQLTTLQAAQQQTLQQLLGLRLEQVRLRQQQLTALQGLLHIESSSMPGTPLQVSAVGQTVSLLDASLIDMQAAAAALVRFDAPMEDSIAAAEMVSHADARAESISQMAR
eukprot:jgi/Chrzof1/2586/Cz11g21090.t1